MAEKKEPEAAAQPPEDKYEFAATLAEALTRFQAEMPEIARTQTGDTGNHTYLYADGADINRLVLPILTRHGLAFSSKPMYLWPAYYEGHEPPEPLYVLHYELRYWPTGEVDEGDLPLNAKLSSQAKGSEITYARRQAFTAILHVSPHDDDDAASAEAEVRGRAAAAVSQQRAQAEERRQGPPRGQLRSSRPAASPESGAGPAATSPAPDPGPGAAEVPADPGNENEHSDSVTAQLLAEEAVKVVERDAGLTQLQADVYELARKRHLLTATVVHPKTGERTTLTRVITECKNILAGRQKATEQEQ